MEVWEEWKLSKEKKISVKSIFEGPIDSLETL